MHPIFYEIKEALRGCYSESEAMSLAKMLLVEVFGFSTLELYGGKDRVISENERTRLKDILVRLQQNEPIQYILGSEMFCGLSARVYAYGVASEFLLVDGVSEDAEIWEERFKESLFVLSRKRGEHKLPARSWF